jgi:hypothetical protein
VRQPRVTLSIYEWAPALRPDRASDEPRTFLRRARYGGRAREHEDFRVEGRGDPALRLPSSPRRSVSGSSCSRRSAHVAGDPDDNARREARKGGFDGGFRPPPPDLPPPPADATAEEILAYYGGNEPAMRRELTRSGRESQLRVIAESLVALTPAVEAKPEAGGQSPANMDAPQGVVLPTPLVEEAMRLHVHEQLGRPKLQVELPGLGDWGARAVLQSAKAGKPYGLWLEDDRLRWGAAITPVWSPGAPPGAGARANAPAPPRLRLPRP